MLIDLCAIENERQFDCDICVVGAGPAGIALADRLRGSGLSILLLESGGFNLELGTQGLYKGTRMGAPYFRLDACRWRMFG
ncbi:MAG TPA: NAD(P)-binding protein, partial [Aquabacterium sp.]|nr:NAD(P)-binding protein [Aquabacterium sp.]